MIMRVNSLVYEIILDENTLVIELALLKTKRVYSKCLITMDFVYDVFHEGIKQINVLQWLK